MAQPPESGWVQQVMRTWMPYLGKVPTGEICRGACEVGRLAHPRACGIALYREPAAERVYQKTLEVGEGGRAAAELLWSRRRGGHYQLLWPPEGEGNEDEVEGDKRETTDVDEVELGVELVA